MNLIEIDKVVNNSKILDSKIDYYIKKSSLKQQLKDKDEVKGYIEKAEHNLRFIRDNLEIGYLDWCVTGCYYAVYQASMALIVQKGYSSKNHDATLCVLIKEYYNKGITKEDVEMINKVFFDYQDLLFYVDSKNKREQASYSTGYKYDKKEVEELRIKTIRFVDKVKNILEEV